MFIVFEGVDWSWKDTQLTKAFWYLTKKDKYMQIFKTSEPSNKTNSWKIISRKLKNEWFSSKDEALRLYVQDRMEQSSFRGYIIKQSTILSSRFDYSTYVYQWLQWFSFHEIFLAHDWYKDILEPDLTFIFSISRENIEKRLQKRWDKKEFFENIDFLEKANQKYIEISKQLSDRRKIYLIDANWSIEETFEKVKTKLDSLFKFS